jgi:hypothetical protein
VYVHVYKLCRRLFFILTWNLFFLFALTISISISISIYLNRVLTGMVLGVLFNKSSSSSSSSSAGSVGGGDITNNNNYGHSIEIGKGLLQGCSLCAIVLISTAIWLAGIGLTSSSESESESNDADDNADDNASSSTATTTPSHQGLVEKEKLKDE